ncbi:MAG: hypothetical protein UX37_C0017G0003 [Microgenomates group bacterium GW2011_GWA2_46_16]|nr:MAG: hypothetical protein UX37_C0017G0003 [Microgenomates group bacterium GW2011_GWA2_46_16]
MSVDWASFLKVIILNGSKLTQKELDKTLATLPHLLENKKELVDVLEETSDQKATNYGEILTLSDNKSVIEYFTGKIPDQDILILKSALVLKSALELGEETWNLRQQIILRHGDRGRIITNLCTGDYYISWIKPTYEAMSSLPSFSNEEFRVVYEDIISNCRFAAFVSSNMSASHTIDLITRKMNMAKKAGIKSINVHGIGEENIAKIKNILKKITEEYKLREFSFEQSGKIFKTVIGISDYKPESVK